MTGLVDSAYTFGSYARADLGGTLLQRKLRDRGVSLTKSATRAVFRDDIVRELARRGGVSADACEAYHEAARDYLLRAVDLTVGVNEDILRRFHALRLDHFGDEVFRAAWREKGGEAHGIDGIDQISLAAAYINRDVHFFYISESAFLPDLLRDVNAALAAGKRAVCLAGDPADGLLPGPEEIALLLPAGVTVLYAPGTAGCMDFSQVTLPRDLEKDVDRDGAILFGYGEDALLACHNLSLPALVTITPRGIPAKAVTGLFTRLLTSRILIPARFSIYPTVPLTRRTELSYYQLAILAEKYGESVYFTPWRELARRDPGVFLNVYDDHLPPVPATDFRFTGDSFGADRAAWCAGKLASMRGIKPLHGCFSLPDFTPVTEDWEAREKREQILADGVLVSPGTPVKVLPLAKAAAPRALFFDRKERGSAVLSNFTFFFTEKLLTNYNDRLKDRPKERIDFPVGTLDYYRYTDEKGVRHETLPLYNKAALAMGEKGFYAFDYALAGGGAELLPGLSLFWTASQVNALHPELTVFTPLLSAPDEEKEDKDYLLLVGKDRLNIAVIGERILCARRGEVALPCIGTVFSLNGEAAKRAGAILGEADKDGYYDVSRLPAPAFRPDPPENISPQDWAGMKWVYGGGLGLTGADGEITADNYMARFRRAGWLSPLSRQTQESRVHTMVRHPRTAVGITKKGELFILVVSGRTPLSVGADYIELRRVARLLAPELSALINWDGGGSSVLGLLEGNVFTELNYPAPSDGSITGQARAVNSVLYIETCLGGMK